ncbi:MAG TPA: efflux RND transporter periplasmic adaptor subunit [Xanthobacteraceae bacterium]|nr:efflux RND transporter periplasmic adaptor subunit [Xanthobacteraceae bacterium]
MPEDHRPAGETVSAPSSRPRRTLRWVGLLAAVVAIAVATAGILLRRTQEAEVAQWTETQATPTVAVIAAKQGVSGQHLVLPGDIQAWYEAPIFSRVSGYLKNWYFDYGAHVKKGDLLAEIDAPDLDGQLAAARGKLNSASALVKVRESEAQFAKTTYARWRDSPKGVVSVQEQESKQADYDSAVARVHAAEAEVRADQGDVERLQALEGFKRITAPFDGVVTARETDIGALINAGSATGPELFKVADIHKMRVYVQVPQQLTGSIKEGLTADLHLPQYPDKIFKAVIVTTSGAINMAARTLLVELHADNPDDMLQPGAYARVEFDLPSNANIVRIPTSALMFRENGLQVATIGPDDKVELKPVTLGRNLGTEVEVLHGLEQSDRIINSPPDSLANGDVVRVAGTPAPTKDASASVPVQETAATTPPKANVAIAPDPLTINESKRRRLKQ